MKSAVVLLSGGQDSTTSLYWAKGQFDVIYAVSFNYGQRHACELSAAYDIAKLAGITHQVFAVSALTELADSALINGSPITAGGGLADHAAPEGLPSSFVPGRNLLFLSTAAAYAVKVGAKDLVTGVCQTDYSGYPDCRREFIDALEVAASLAMPSSCGPIKIHTPLMFLSKAETVKLARSLPGCWEALAATVTCYEGLRPGCGKCPACLLRSRGFIEAGEVDPAC